MGFRTYLIGEKGSAASLAYRIRKSDQKLLIRVPINLAHEAGLADGDDVQLAVGYGEHAGKFGLAKRETHTRRLARLGTGACLQVVFPWTEELRVGLPAAPAWAALVAGEIKPGSGILPFSRK